MFWEGEGKANPGEATKGPRPFSMWESGVGQDAEVFSGRAPVGTRQQGLIPNLPLMTQGVVPYLGTFLSDLVVLDTAMEDYLEVGEPEDCGGGTRVLRTGSRESPD